MFSIYLESVQELEESLKALIVRNNELFNLLSDAGIEVPPFKGPKFLSCVFAVRNNNGNVVDEKIEKRKFEGNIGRNIIHKKFKKETVLSKNSTIRTDCLSRFLDSSSLETTSMLEQAVVQNTLVENEDSEVQQLFSERSITC